MQRLFHPYVLIIFHLAIVIPSVIIFLSMNRSINDPVMGLIETPSPNINTSEGSVEIGPVAVEKAAEPAAEKPSLVTGIPGIVPPTTVPGTSGVELGRQNDSFGREGSVGRKLENAWNDVTAGPGPNNEVARLSKEKDLSASTHVDIGDIRERGIFGGPNSVIRKPFGENQASGSPPSPLPEKQSSRPSIITQTTEGSCSPSIGSVSGNIVIDTQCMANRVASALDKIHEASGKPPDVGSGSARPIAASDQNDSRPSDPFEEQQRELERYVRSIPARYNAPDRLTYGRSIQISFVLEPQGPGTGAARLANFPGEVKETTASVSPLVEAELRGPKDLVQIELWGGEKAKRKAVTLGAPVQWVWDVKAVGEGKANLLLEIISYIPDKDRSFPVTTFQREIPIEILWWDRVKLVILNMAPVISPVWAAIATIATAIAGLFTYFGWKPSFGRANSGKAGKPRSGRR